MDGVPGLTQAPIPAGAEFTYEFTLPESGTFWFHPHFGTQLDRGLYTPLVIEDPAEPGTYDRDLTVVFDDWLDTTKTTPDQTLQGLREHGMQMTGPDGSMQMASSPLLGGDAGDVMYPLFLANGRPPTDPPVFEVKHGERVRLRLLNAGSDTAFRVALGGHRLTVTHTDGFPVEPVTVDALLIGMSERYDVTFTVAGSDSYPLVALAEGKTGQAMAVFRAGTAATPAADTRPGELDGRLLQLGDLHAARAVAIAPKSPTRTHAVELGGPGAQGYHWTINGKEVDNEAQVLNKAKVLKARQGERVRLVFTNPTTMFHPMHLHGHTFQVVAPGGAAGPRKDSLIVRPKERIAVDFDANNPGQWLIHCHNLYHQAAGMHSVLSYVH
jgi:FtsP/CotA-like multicopper oxidase with cupredoxin domain